jgi:protein tyrosine/serine phosphatase
MVSPMTTAWIELDGTANTRDLGGLPVEGGGTVAENRLLRSDNLQNLTEDDVRALVHDHDVHTVVDLRTGVEVRSEGPGPLSRLADVEIQHLSLFPEAGENTDAGALNDSDEEDSDEDAPVVLPWEGRKDDAARPGVSGVYLSYLDQRADSAILALRAIAHAPGATLVHCAAGKDRTGTVIALALAEVGVERDAIVDDYAASGERIDQIMDRLRGSRTYQGDITSGDNERHRPRAVTMQRFLDALDADFGSPSAWLRTHGWTETDSAALKRKLLAHQDEH